MEMDVAEVTKYEQMLEKDPNSLCFAPLADLYRKAGLLEQALAVATHGAELHPSYEGGLIALARAYQEQGLKAEARAVFERVVASSPENLRAQKHLANLYLEAGDLPAAERALNVVVMLDGSDKDAQQKLDTLRQQVKPQSSAKEAAGSELLGGGEFDFSFGDEGDEAPEAEPPSRPVAVAKPLPPPAQQPQATATPAPLTIRQPLPASSPLPSS
ncbi:MAG TPA: tetratricopeptide repeat protein, partial [Geobacterales bacterium]|nr:tetratricopeptide repeat protein [Geobacterales bacterium]